jgi:hypothetical protein
MKRALRAAVLAASGVGVLGAWSAVSLPSKHLTLAPASEGTLAGILHVHTNRSDGRYAPEQVAAIAAQAGIKFLVFTDHGDATRPPDPPTYRSGVLCLDGVEISTAGGHYIALDMPVSPYPLAGEARDVVDDVHRLGGFGVAAHPDSPKPELRWNAWDSPFDAVEWVNPDTSWRVLAADGWGSRLRLVQALLHYPFRQAETLAGLLTGAEETISRWNTIAARRPVVGLAGSDAHANLALLNADPGDTRFSIPLPSYDASFHMLSVHVTPEQPLSGNAAADAAILMRAIRSGHLYLAVAGLAAPPELEFTAVNARGRVGQGEELAVGGPVSLTVRSNAPEGFTTIIWRGAEMLASEQRSEVSIVADEEPAVYRAEVRAGDRQRPQTWLLSNAIYLRAPETTPAAAPPAVAALLELFDGKTDSGWHLETDPTSLAAVDVARTVDGAELRVRYGLSGDESGSQWAALVWGTPIGHPPTNVANFDRLTFTGRAERPMRISVQLRTGNEGEALRRWQRSVYLDTSDQEHSVRFSEVVPSAGTDEPVPPLDQISQILFVVDTRNNLPGSSGRFWIKRAAFER